MLPIVADATSSVGATAAYKDLVGQTRKFTVPLMEYFDTEKVTIRRGNVRVLRGEGS